MLSYGRRIARALFGLGDSFLIHTNRTVHSCVVHHISKKGMPTGIEKQLAQVSSVKTNKHYDAEQLNWREMIWQYKFIGHCFFPFWQNANLILDNHQLALDQINF